MKLEKWIKKKIESFYDKFFSQYHKSVKINLTDIDVLKVAHHGADGSSSEEFLNLLKPKKSGTKVLDFLGKLLLTKDGG